MTTFQDALKHLASIDLIDLCKEAKVECCRATRDLRSCGQPVECVLKSCGHASLCAECSQRCEICPICRVPLNRSGNKLRLRLYFECVEAGLISKACDRVNENDSDENVQRLYSLFDVAMENNLCCLICQYVTDVCMDESAVSSDPVIAFLLDEVVVKDWCKRTFKNIILELRRIYVLGVKEMKTKMKLLIKFSVNLAGVSNVLDVLESSFKGRSARLDDLQHLQEGILKTKQHMDMMLWCIRHEFLENVKSRYNRLTTWKDNYSERKAAALDRAWPEPPDPFMEPRQDHATLFIADALLNLETEHSYEQERLFELEIASLQKDGGSAFFRAKIEGLAGFYPFEDIRAAVDILFLYGSSDMVVAKQAIFLYYLFDRHWTLPDDQWRDIVDDFAMTFGTTRQALLESFTFYLLDDHTNDALQEACRMLPEISGAESHPKIAKVLLERDAPDVALMFLRWSGVDGGITLPSLSEAVTAVRVRVECALLTESFIYQRTVCTKVKENALRPQLSVDDDNSDGEVRSWVEWMEVLVTELCNLCIRRNLVDRLIEFPWNSDEEKYLHKCLLDYSVAFPSSINGNLLVAFYLQRYRYAEAYHVDHKLRTVEEEFICKGDLNEEVLYRMTSATHWRTELVRKCVELLPEVQQQQLKAGMSLDGTILPGVEIKSTRDYAAPEAQEDASIIPPVSSFAESSLILQMDEVTSFRPSGSGNLREDGSLGNSHSELGKFASPFAPRGSLFSATGKGVKSQFEVGKNFKFDGLLTPQSHKTSFRVLQDEFQDGHPDETLANGNPSGFYHQLPKVRPPYSRRVMAKPTKTPCSNQGLVNDSPEERYTSASGKRRSAGADTDSGWNIFSQNDGMEISPSGNEENGSAENLNTNGGPRWRSDDTSEEDEELWVDRNSASGRKGASSIRRPRRSRFLRR